jgi:outer membrane protein OmpA-like peptidoglycan-associated protein
MPPQRAERGSDGPARLELGGSADAALDSAPQGVADVMRTLQRGVGNALAARYAQKALLARQDGGTATAPPVPVTDAGVPAPAGTTAADPEAELTAAEHFVEGGPYKKEVTPGGANTEGGFEAEYDPKGGMLQIRLRVAFNFKDAVDSSLIPFDPALTPLVTRARRLRGDRRRRFLAQYQWPASADDPMKVKWREDLKKLIDSSWGGKYEFHLNKPQWEWIGAKVAVDIDVHNGPKGGNDHLAVDAVKFPEGQNMYSFNQDPENVAAGRKGFSYTEAGTGTDPHDQHMVLGSTDIAGRPDFNVLRQSVTFAPNSATLDPAATGFLDNWIATFSGKTSDDRSVNQQVTLESHTSATGTAARNTQLAQDRATAVRDYLNGHGFTNVATRVTLNPRGTEGAHGGEDIRDRRVDLVVGAGDRQVLAVHEFGHAFGLDDEYADTPLYGGSGAAVGDPTTHDAATKAMQDEHGAALKGAIHEETDSIMSAGNVIRPQHYSMFHKALTDITSQSPWALGAPSAKPAHATPTGGPSDAGVPAGVP